MKPMLIIKHQEAEDALKLGWFSVLH